MIEQLKQERLVVAPSAGLMNERWEAFRQQMQPWVTVLGLLLLHTAMVFTVSEALKVTGVFPNTSLGALTAEVLAVTAATGLTWRWLQRRSWAQMGLRLNLAALQDLSFGAFSMAAAQTLLWGVLVVLGAAKVHFAPLASWQAYLVPLGEAVLLWALVAWGEEIWVHGFWLQVVADGYHRLTAGRLPGTPPVPGAAARLAGAVISSVFFVLLHLRNGHFNALAAVGIFLGGMFLAYAYVCSDTLWLPIGMHFGWNFFEGTVFGFPVSGMWSFSLLQTRLTGPAWLTGGAFGPEAGWAALPVMLFAFGMIAVYTSRRAKPGDKKACAERLKNSLVNLFAVFGAMLR